MNSLVVKVVIVKMAYRAFSLTWPASMQILFIGAKESVYIRKEFKFTGLVWDTNTAAVTSGENAPLGQ